MNDNGWTPDVRAHVFDAIEAVEEKLIAIMDERDRRYATADRLRAEAIRREADAQQNWRDASNEWRQAMQDRETKFLPRGEFTEVHNALINRMERMENSIAEGTGRQRGISQLTGILIAIIPSFIAVAAIVTAILLHK